jgi:hypothetical protein
MQGTPQASRRGGFTRRDRVDLVLRLPGSRTVARKPNILILWGDDIGWWNISCNSRGQMGYATGQFGIAEDTIVMYSTHNGVHYNTWPDAGITPYRSE